MSMSFNYLHQKIILMLFLGHFSIAPKVQAQTYYLVDSVTNVYYQQADWQNLYNFCKETKLDQFKSFSLNKRYALAAFLTKRNTKAEKLLYKSLALNRSDSTIQQLAYLIYNQIGEQQLANFWLLNYQNQNSKWRLNSLSAETGTKWSINEEPGHLLHFQIAENRQWNRNWQSSQFLSFNKQPYFWENFKQYNYAFLISGIIHRHWQIDIPLQLAWFNAAISSDNIENQQILSKNIGNSQQQVANFGLSGKYFGPGLGILFGVNTSWAKTNVNYNIISNTSPTTNLSNIDTAFLFNQKQLNIGLYKRFYINNKPITLSFQTAIIQAFNTSYLNIKPSITWSINAKTWLYTEYWHKNRYLLHSADAGLLINNFNTKTNRFLITFNRQNKKGHSLALTWLFEKGNDLLYNRAINYHGTFLKINYLLKK